MQNFFKKIKLVWTDRTLRKRVLFVLVALIVFMLLSNIPIPGVDKEALSGARQVTILRNGDKGSQLN